MRNALDWKAKLVVAGILVIFAGFIFYIDWIWDTQGGNLALLQISLFVAIIAALVALWSLKMTRDSLELTRTTTRPFLNVADPSLVFARGQVKGVGATARNSGNLPADGITINFELFTRGKKDTIKEILGMDSKCLSLSFPAQETDIFYNVEKPEHSKLILDGKCGFRITISYHRKLAEKGCKTIRTYSIIKIEDVLQFSPVPDEDYWD